MSDPQNNCPRCNRQFTTNENGHPLRKTLMVVRPHLPPLSVYVCPDCWRAAVPQRTPAEGHVP